MSQRDRSRNGISLWDNNDREFEHGVSLLDVSAIRNAVQRECFWTKFWVDDVDSMAHPDLRAAMAITSRECALGQSRGSGQTGYRCRTRYNSLSGGSVNLRRYMSAA
jgi:hypothetical protein